MQKFRIILGALLLFCSCGNKDKEDQESVVKETNFDYQKMPQRQVINAEARAVLDEWEAFGKLSRSFEILYQARNHEDLKLAIEDLLENEKLLSESKYPEEFDKLQIKSRQRVLKTFLLKAKADAEENRNATESVVQMLEAYNAFRNQFNVIVSNKLELDLILDEG